MLKSATAAMSAIFGGCDGLTIFPESDEDSMMARIARNVSSVLREESHLSKVADPTAGSYYLDSLIEQLADQSWRVFQKQMTE
jgi:methylmalonyl-CoA mutase